MIETNFDNCVGPLHSVCRTKVLYLGQRESPFEEWVLEPSKIMSARAL